MAKRDYYEVLGVARTCSADDIKQAFRRIAKENHPDIKPGDKAAEEKMKEAAEAYAILSDGEKRQMYDRFGATGPMGSGFPGGGFGSAEDVFTSFGDIFEEIFGGFTGRGGAAGGRARPRRGNDLQMELELSFEEAATGVAREIEITKPTACETCSGSGAKAGTQPVACPTCGGRGMVSHSQGLFAFSSTCPRCGGAGRVIKDPCESCRGQGVVRKKKKLKVEIPAGVDAGDRVQIGAEGEPGERGGPAGDLYLRVHLKEHELFSREGEHLICRVPVGYAQLALGAKIEVPSLDGKKELAIPAGAQSGDTFVIKGAGFPRPRRHGRGDEIVQVFVVTPKKISARQKELLEELGKLEGAEGGSADEGMIGKLKKKFRGGAK